jgi:hypothetical protein
MAEFYFPFDSGAGANVFEDRWSLMAKDWRSDGVVVKGNILDTWADDLAVDETTPNSMGVRIRSGEAFIRGHKYINDASFTLTIPPAHASFNRTDYVVLRLDWVENTISAALLKGVEDGTNSIPTLTQTQGSRWEIPLATISVPAGATAITRANITDQRETSGYYAVTPTCIVTHSSNQTLGANGAVLTMDWDTDVYSSIKRMHDEGPVATNDTIRIPESGLYYIAFHAGVSVGSGSLVNFDVMLNDGSTSETIVRASTLDHTGSIASASASTIRPLRKGDQLYVVARNWNTSNTKTVVFSTKYTPYFMVKKLDFYV